jgi:DNA repair protein RecN (Recombination protein N)
LLLELRVNDLGIIEDLDWKLDNGFNVITGESGAGKSLVIDAVELLLIGSASEDVIRHDANRALIEGIFILGGSPQFERLKSLLDQEGLTAEDNSLAINCEIRQGRPSTVRINGRAVTKSLLRQVGRLLIDIHGQSEHLSLLDKKHHLDILDTYSHNSALKNEFAAKAARFRELVSQLNSLITRQTQQTRQQEYLKFQIDEIRKANLREGEDQELESEKHLISFSAKLKEYSAQLYQTLSEGENSRYSESALTKLNQSLLVLRKLVQLDASLNPHLDCLKKTVSGVEELARDIRGYTSRLEFDPRRLEEVESRLELIRNLKRKYANSIGDILNFLARSERELEDLGQSLERKGEIEKSLAGLKQAMRELAERLSASRSQGAANFARQVKNELDSLEMSQMRFEVSITRSPSSEGLECPDGTTYSFTDDGVDNIEFMVSTNPGEPLRPLAKIASTGEISRFTLALKSVISETDTIPVLIFDEIDIGIGGRSGDIIGKKLWALSRSHQVICVTHLPQIAVYADAHFCVQKESASGRTTSTLKNLQEVPRTNELAAMLAGKNYSETARQNATELLQNAARWKTTQ